MKINFAWVIIIIIIALIISLIEAYQGSFLRFFIYAGLVFFMKVADSIMKE